MSRDQGGVANGRRAESERSGDRQVPSPGLECAGQSGSAVGLEHSRVVFMVGVAQRLERQTVALEVGGSSPLTHPGAVLDGAEQVSSRAVDQVMEAELLACGHLLSCSTARILSSPASLPVAVPSSLTPPPEGVE